jgi:hypothetical protein
MSRLASDYWKELLMLVRELAGAPDDVIRDSHLSSGAHRQLEFGQGQLKLPKARAAKAIQVGDDFVW